MPGQRHFLQTDDQPRPHQPECVETHPHEVEPLLSAVDFGTCHWVLDPWAGTKGVAAAFRQRGITCVTNDINPVHRTDTHCDALQPSWYLGFYNRGNPPDAIVTSPWFRLLDLALPLAVLYATKVAALHVPGHYITDAHPARVRYLHTLHRQGRLAIIVALPRKHMGRRCLWIVVFASRTLRNTSTFTSLHIWRIWR